MSGARRINGGASRRINGGGEGLGKEMRGPGGEIGGPGMVRVQQNK